MQELCSILEKAGKPAAKLAFADGTRLLVQPFGGRLLGLYPSTGDTNFLWTNPALSTIAKARDFFARDGWINTGGDRTWLAPEIELFIGNLTRPTDTYAVQPALDPGNWTLASATSTELCMENRTTVQLHRSGRKVGVRLEKHYRPAPNPVSNTPLADTCLQYAGYTQVTVLETDAHSVDGAQLGIWNLLQLPQPGSLLVPTLDEVHPKIVFGTPSAEELAVKTRLIRWNMSPGGKDAKIGLKAPSVTGRAGYLHKSTPRAWDLVVREFEVDPCGDYVDALWNPPHETGWAFQACCVRNGDERFNELEYHAPAAAVGSSIGRDESRVWAFRGPRAAITSVAKMLLGTESLDVK